MLNQTSVPAYYDMPYPNNGQMYNGTQQMTQGEKDLVMYYRKEVIKTNAELACIQAKKNASMELAAYKNQLNIYKAGIIAEKNFSRELASYGLIYNTLGQICREASLPDITNKAIISRPIMNVQNMCMIKIFSASGRECTLVTWDSNPKGILLYGKESIPKFFGRELEKNGVQLLVAGRHKKNILEQLFAFLCDKAKTIELPDHFGWNKMTDGRWYFESEIKKTMEGIADEGRKN